MATQKGKKISQQTVADSIDGAELLPFAKNGDSGAVTSQTIVNNARNGLVEQEEGKGLSTNDYTDADKNKLNALPTNDNLTAELASKQGALSVSEDLSLSADNELSLTDKAKMRLFIDQWDAAWKVSGTVYGKYDPENAPDALHPFMGNDVWMTYEEAIQIMNCAATLSAYQRIAFNFLNVRTLPPIPLGFYVTYVDINYMREMECIRFVQAQLPYIGGIAPANIHFLYECRKLKRIEGVISLENFSAQCLNGYFLKDDAALKEVRLTGLKTNISLVSSPLLSLASLQYLIANAANTATITVTVHKDVYAKLTGDTTNAAAAALTEEELTQWQALVTTAAAKSISFATV